MKKKPPAKHEYIPEPEDCHEDDIYFIKSQLEKWTVEFRLQLCSDYTEMFRSELEKNLDDVSSMNKARRVANINLMTRTNRYVTAMARHKENINNKKSLNG